MITKEQLLKMKRWYYPHISNHELMIMSGWKLYVFGETLDDSYHVCSLLIPIMEKYNLTMKAASQHVIDRNTNMERTPAWSIAVIYLHANLFEKKKLSTLVADIQASLKDYPKEGEVKGAKSVDGKIHYRYDLSKSVEPSQGVIYDKYVRMYRGEYGSYNIPGNPDIIELFKT